MTEDAYDLLIFGGTRNTGLLIARLATARHWRVAAMVRPGSDSTAIEAAGVDVIAGDAFSVDDCWRAVAAASPRRIVSTMGGKDANGRRVDFVGNRHIIDAAVACGRNLDRFVLVTSMGCGDQYAGTSEKVKLMLGEALRAKTEAENALMDSALPWTILRPGGLSNDPPNGEYDLLRRIDAKKGGYISREDVASAVLTLLDDAAYRRAIVTIQSTARQTA